MRRIKRLSRFGMVGITSTIIHGLVLACLVRFLSLPNGPANTLAFIVAFCFSMTAQQAFTFHDRLAGQKLKKRSLLLLFLINCLLAYGLGSLLQGPGIYLLILVPALINFLLLHFFSGHAVFKR